MARCWINVAPPSATLIQPLSEILDIYCNCDVILGTQTSTLSNNVKFNGNSYPRHKRRYMALTFRNVKFILKLEILYLPPPAEGIRRSLIGVCSITEVKQRRALLIIGWVTAWDCQVLYALVGLREPRKSDGSSDWLWVGRKRTSMDVGAVSIQRDPGKSTIWSTWYIYKAIIDIMDDNGPCWVIPVAR